MVSVGGDLSPLEEAFGTVGERASAAAKDIDAALSSVNIGTELQSSLKALDDSFAATGTVAQNTAGQMDLFATSAEEASKAAEQLSLFDTKSIDAMDTAFGSLNDNAKAAADGLDKVAHSAHGAGEAAHEAEGGMNGLLEEMLKFGAELLALEALKEFATEALNTYGAIEKVTISLTALTGSAEGAEETIGKLKTLAMSDALSFPQLTAAAQKMTAMGFSTEETFKTLRTAADVGAGVGIGLDRATSAMERMILSGAVNARQLSTLALNTETLGKAFSVLGPGMEKTGEEVGKAFKALDQSDRIEVLNEALKKFNGNAAAVAEGIKGEFQKLKTSIEFAMEEIGKSLAEGLKPVVADIQSNVIPAFSAMAKGVTDLVSAFGPLIGGILHQMALDFHDLGIAVGSVTSAIGVLLTPLRDLGLVSGTTADNMAQLWRVFRDITTLGLAELPGLIANISAQFKSFGEVLGAIGRIIVDLATGDLAKLTVDIAALPKLLNDYSGAIDLAHGITKQFGISTKGLTDELEKAAKIHNDVAEKAGSNAAANKAAKAAVDALKTALNSAQQDLVHVTEAYRKHTATIADLKAAFDKVDEAQAALAAKLPKLGEAHMTAAKAAEAHADAEGLINAAVAKFVGPVQEGFSHGIEVIAGSHRNAEAAAHAQALGIQMLVAEMPKLTSTTEAATNATNALAVAFNNVKSSVDLVNAAMSSFKGTQLGGTPGTEGFGSQLGIGTSIGGTISSSVGPGGSIVQTIGGAPSTAQVTPGGLGGNKFGGSPASTPGGPAPIIQAPTISAADTGQLAGLLSQIESDLVSILTAIQNLGAGVNVQVSAAAALNTTASTLQDTTAGLQTVATGLTEGFAQTTQALQTVALVTAGGTAAMLTGIRDVIATVVPIVQAVSPQMARVPLSQLGVAQGSALPGGTTLHVTVQAGTVVGSGGMTELSNIVGDNIVAKLQQMGIRVQ